MACSRTRTSGWDSGRSRSPSTSARFGWPTPKLGRTELNSQIFTGTHLSERHRQIFIVALGELVLAAGTEMNTRNFAGGAIAACGVAFGTSVLLFLLYFQPARHLFAPPRGGVVERVKPGTSTSYCHLVMVGGVLLLSTGLSLVVDDPYGDSPLSWILILLGGPALFLLGTCLFHHLVTARILGCRVTTIVVLAAIGPAMPLLPPLGVMAVAGVVLLGALLAEFAIGRIRAAANPGPG
ncbi:low temperature requirement protein A [Plantactinospora sonchi]|uniref:Low temperature requirement protein A n=1 Tax=Plantactinospora sonchi TaxID=1544735 RepID=A0ABU7RVZ9_9ACTN